MAHGFSRSGLTAVCLSAALALGACGGAPAPESSVAQPAVAADAELSRVATAMQKTILEGALAGAAAGGGIAMTLGTNRKKGIQIGTAVGASAGSYVAFIQRKYFFKERRLEAMKSDLDRNSEEVAATISVMQGVLAAQKAELDSLRAQASTGGDPAALDAGVAQAQANLSEMQRAIEGATNRQAEFTEARGLVPADGGGSRIDPELSALSSQIAEMRAIADDLAGSL
ncbi:hypothetical protein [Defluviimonas sp. WL0075]|uniref:Glycine zipper domain-containing protein n=1 Tax=Albidovulum sediminicola TaxID=2984331 RepID=A0ABT2Z5M2_9RHOB|nr:hypothetical protein [Defluviimonas sp. WL0075]MCV2866445.1 hypothetical protein [Defluviimonas sp. WL0075]